MYLNGIPFIRPSLKNYLTLEYLMQVVEMVKCCDDEYMIEDYMQEIEQYLHHRETSDGIRDLMINTLKSDYVKLKSLL